MEQIKLSFKEFYEGFSDYIKNTERLNIILYYILEDRIIFTFTYDFQYIIEVSLDDLSKHYNNPTLSNEQLLEAFKGEYLEMKSVSVKHIIKYII